MANPEHLKILKQGVTVWNAWRLNNRLLIPNLGKAILNRADLEHAMLSHSKLTAADLTNANLRYADLEYSDLFSSELAMANLRDANLRGAVFSGARLSNADLRGADLYGATLNAVELDGANFADARTGDTVFTNLDLRKTKGLEEIAHDRPSTIGIDTLYLSKGRIPEIFLRGCGVPNEMIELSRSLMGRPIEFNSCFISYSTKDEEFAQRLYNDLQANGVRCWFAPHDMKGGKKLHQQIDWAIHFHDRLLLLLSPDSINSEWVRREIDKARKKEAAENRDVLFPISVVKYKELEKWEYIDTSTGKDVAQEIRSYFIPDFSNWKDHDSYQAAFKKLLEDLKGERAKPAHSP